MKIRRSIWAKTPQAQAAGQVPFSVHFVDESPFATRTAVLNELAVLAFELESDPAGQAGIARVQNSDILPSVKSATRGIQRRLAQQRLRRSARPAADGILLVSGIHGCAQRAPSTVTALEGLGGSSGGAAASCTRPSHTTTQVS